MHINLTAARHCLVQLLKHTVTSLAEKVTTQTYTSGMPEWPDSLDPK